MTRDPSGPQSPIELDRDQLIVLLAELFSNHELGDVCQAGYGDYLATALATIDTACDGFTPPG